MLSTIIHLSYSVNRLTLILQLSFFIYCIILIAIHGNCKRKPDRHRAWKLLCLIPFLISLLHLTIFALGPAITQLLPVYMNIYVPAVLMALFPLMSEKKVLFNIARLLCIPACIFFMVLTLADAGRYTDLSRRSLSEAYIALCDLFENEYIMNDWKKIDYDKIRAQGLTLVEEAEKTGNISKYYEALDEFLYAFHDEHMDVDYYTRNNYNVDKTKSFSDYGLSLVALDDGTVIAVDVEEGLDIKAGDVVTDWNGVPVSEAAESVRLPINVGVAENERFMKNCFLSGVGGDYVKVNFIDSNGSEKETLLNRLDMPISRAFRAATILSSRYGGEGTFDHKMLNDHTGYLGISEESIDDISDSIAYFTGDHKKARELFRTYLRELKEQGMSELIIDIRGNCGGFDEVATALASLFTEEKSYAFSMGIKDKNGIRSISDHYVLPDGEFSDIKVIVLTDMRCASAGDGMVLYLSRIEGITIAGLSNPAGINQETGGKVYMPGGAVIYYPVGLVLNDHGEPNIDIDDTRESRDPVDVKIPLDKEAALKIFEGADYELEWAIDRLNE